MCWKGTLKSLLRIQRQIIVTAFWSDGYCCLSYIAFCFQYILTLINVVLSRHTRANVILMLAHRLRRWPNFNIPLGLLWSDITRITFNICNICVYNTVHTMMLWPDQADAVPCRNSQIRNTILICRYLIIAMTTTSLSSVLPVEQ